MAGIAATGKLVNSKLTHYQHNKLRQNSLPWIGEVHGFRMRGLRHESTQHDTSERENGNHHNPGNYHHETVPSVHQDKTYAQYEQYHDQVNDHNSHSSKSHATSGQYNTHPSGNKDQNYLDDYEASTESQNNFYDVSSFMNGGEPNNPTRNHDDQPLYNDHDDDDKDSDSDNSDPSSSESNDDPFHPVNIDSKEEYVDLQGASNYNLAASQNQDRTKDRTGGFDQNQERPDDYDRNQDRPDDYNELNAHSSPGNQGGPDEYGDFVSAGYSDYSDSAGKYEDYPSVFGKDIDAPERPALDDEGWDDGESEDEVWTKDVNGINGGSNSNSHSPQNQDRPDDGVLNKDNYGNADLYVSESEDNMSGTQDADSWGIGEEASTGDNEQVTLPGSDIGGDDYDASSSQVSNYDNFYDTSSSHSSVSPEGGNNHHQSDFDSVDNYDNMQDSDNYHDLGEDNYDDNSSIVLNYDDFHGTSSSHASVSPEVGNNKHQSDFDSVHNYDGMQDSDNYHDVMGNAPTPRPSDSGFNYNDATEGDKYPNDFAKDKDEDDKNFYSEDYEPVSSGNDTQSFDENESISDSKIEFGNIDAESTVTVEKKEANQIVSAINSKVHEAVEAVEPIIEAIEPKIDPAINACDNWTCRGVVAGALLLTLLVGMLIGRCCCWIFCCCCWCCRRKAPEIDNASLAELQKLKEAASTGSARAAPYRDHAPYKDHTSATDSLSSLGYEDDEVANSKPPEEIV